MVNMIPARPPVAGALSGTPMVRVSVTTVELLDALVTELKSQVLDLSRRVAALEHEHPPHPPHP
jgi:hypothetical protein